MDTKSKGLDVSAKSFLTSLLVIFLLMVLTYILTMVIPAGRFERIMADGQPDIDTVKGFSFVPAKLPFWKWLLSPVLVLGAEGSGLLLAIIVFLLVIGGVFNALTQCSLMSYMLERITERYGKDRYRLLAILTFFFMAMGAFVGSFEEVVPMVPIVTALAISLGWDSITGIGMSLLAVGCGFASGVANPFTVGVAQTLAGLPMFSGFWFRLLGFVLIYCLLWVFLHHHAKRVEKPVETKGETVVHNPKMDKGLKAFALLMASGILIVLLSPVLTFLQDFTMIIVALTFLVAGTVSALLSGMSTKEYLKSFGKGTITMLPAVLMILMASSIKYILTEGMILDTILFGFVMLAEKLPKAFLILFIYLIVLVMNFFISSGSAKAFLLMPLIIPLADILNLSPQICIVAYAFGDGFSNVFYPTNAALLIGLNVAHLGYGEYVRWAWKYQLANLILTSLILLLGVAIGI